MSVVLAAYGTAYAQDWQSVGGNYLGVYCDDGLMLAVGQRGAILRSSDGGASWTAPESATWQDLLFTDFTDGTRGWAWGHKGVVRATSDGGRTWSVTDVPTYTHVAAFSAGDRLTALAVVDSNRLLRTSDGGVTWQSGDEIPIELALSLAMLDDSRGVLLCEGGVILRTTDGGRSWEQVFAGPALALLKVALNSSGAGLAVGMNGAVVTTSDGGATWSSIGSPAADRTLIACAVGEAELLIVGAPRSRNEKAMIFASGDRGSTWAAGEYSTTFGRQSFFAVGVSESDGRAITVGTHGAVYVRDGSAAAWQTVSSTGVRLLDLGNDPIRVGSFASTDTAVVAVAVVSIRTWLRTTDGGITWRTHRPGPAFAGMLNDITFFSSTDGLAVDSYSFRLATTDAGLTWKDAGNSLPSNVFGTLLLSPTHHFAGVGGGIARTTNGGRDWMTTALTDGTFGYGLNRTHFGPLVALGRRFADSGSSDNGEDILYRSDDGGVLWQPILRQPGPGELWEADFFTTDIGVAVGYTFVDGVFRGRIYRTTDAGNTWTVSDHPPILRSVRCFNDRDGYVVGDSQFVIKTTDAGATWVRDSLWSDPSGPYGSTDSFRRILLSTDRRTILLLGQGQIARKRLAVPVPSRVESTPTRADDRSLRIRPLQASERFYMLESPSVDFHQASVWLVDVLGRSQQVKHAPSYESTVVDLSGAPDGHYWLVINNGRQTVTGRIITLQR
jgi:photosystem II stability/assembly factor-like uncharacterized protein